MNWALNCSKPHRRLPLEILFGVSERKVGAAVHIGHDELFLVLRSRRGVVKDAWVVPAQAIRWRYTNETVCTFPVESDAGGSIWRFAFDISARECGTG